MAMCYVVKDFSWGWIFGLGWVISGFANQNLFCAQVRPQLLPACFVQRSASCHSSISANTDAVQYLLSPAAVRVHPAAVFVCSPDVNGYTISATPQNVRSLMIVVPVLQHELSHFLAFKKPLYNKVLSVLSNTVLVVPTATTFRKYHQEHHSHLVCAL